MRLIPKMRGTWLFNLMSIIAFASIVMTYFGVNFYLVGLHSYASGDKVITPDFVYYSILYCIYSRRNFQSGDTTNSSADKGIVFVFLNL